MDINLYTDEIVRSDGQSLNMWQLVSTVDLSSAGASAGFDWTGLDGEEYMVELINGLSNSGPFQLAVGSGSVSATDGKHICINAAGSAEVGALMDLSSSGGNADDRGGRALVHIINMNNPTKVPIALSIHRPINIWHTGSAYQASTAATQLYYFWEDVNADAIRIMDDANLGQFSEGIVRLYKRVG